MLIKYKNTLVNIQHIIQTMPFQGLRVDEVAQTKEWDVAYLRKSVHCEQLV